MSLTADDWTAVLLSLRIAGVATLASLPFAIAAAWALARGRFAGRLALDVLVHLPLVLPPVVTGYGLLVLFGRRGPLGAALDQCCGIVLSFRWTGAALAAAIMAFPLMVRSIRLSFEHVDRKIEEAAETLGANPTMRFFTISLPLALPGILAGMIMAFAKALGEFGATITFVSAIPGETKTLPASIYAYTQVPGGENNALALSFIAALIAVVAVVASELLTRRTGKNRT